MTLMIIVLMLTAFFAGVITTIALCYHLDQRQAVRMSQIQADQDAAIAFLASCKVVGVDPNEVKTSKDVLAVWYMAEAKLKATQN